ncbi:MAG: PQQ-dependent sugar dehydrogenase [Armatimonadetes bacterium]|nr:PQQ-dependent sugar dehydrogenase [Armatimonadota bacterium]
MKPKHPLLPILLVLVLFIAAAKLNAQYQYEAAPAFSDSLVFQTPVDIVSARDGSNRLFVVEQGGIIRAVQNDPNAAVADTFLNIKRKVSVGSETGLLGLAFHPKYQQNGYLYVNYTAANPLRTIVARYHVDPNNPKQCDTASEVILLEIPQPYKNNKAGKIAFGPDGTFFIAVGDGGGTGDPERRAQNLTLLLGKVLRIDVNRTSNGKNYAIPADNPFFGNSNGYAEEIWAWGFRNPWRFSFDPITYQLWLGDVGLYSWEEINIVEGGKNYGWNIMEGTRCFNSIPCDTSNLTKPVWTYPRDVGRTVIGGYVYRGTAMPELQGNYIYGDFTSGSFWALNPSYAMTGKQLFQQRTLSLSSFGVDDNHELLLTSYNGRVYRLRQSPFSNAGNSAGNAVFGLQHPRPNPAANGQILIPFSLGSPAFISIALFDGIGREVARIFDGTREAGHHEIAFDTSILPVGMYFCRLSSGAHTDIQTVMVQ